MHKYSDNLPSSGKYGLFREMLKLKEETGRDTFSVNFLSRKLDKNPSVVRKQAEELEQEGYAVKQNVSSTYVCYRPDSQSEPSPTATYLSKIRDIRNFMRQLRTQDFFECSKCGKLFKPLFPGLQIPRRPCQYCGMPAFRKRTSLW